MPEIYYLVEPNVELQAAFLDMAADFRAADEQNKYSHHEKAAQDFSAFLEDVRNMARGIGLPAGHVPMNSFWLVSEDGVVLGESRLRHRLSPELMVVGGHIGYAIRPSARRKGYGTLILKLTLEKARALGLERVLVTCDTDNIGSARIIEKNGGVLENNMISPRSGKLISRYWIEI